MHLSFFVLLLGYVIDKDVFFYCVFILFLVYAVCLLLTTIVDFFVDWRRYTLMILELPYPSLCNALCTYFCA